MRLTSEVVGIGTLALPFVLEAVDVWLSDSETGASDYMTDLLVVTQAVALTTFITGMTKWAVARPRPPTCFRRCSGAFTFATRRSVSSCASRAARAWSRRSSQVSSTFCRPKLACWMASSP